MQGPTKPADNHYEAIISFFGNELSWWTDVYGDALPRGFFSFEMRRRLDLVSALLTEEVRRADNPAVLECGCGPGEILAKLDPLRCSLTGVDLLPKYVDLASKKVPRATVAEGNVEQLPFPDASFDIVYAVGLFQYVDDDRKAAREIARVTKDGGLVLLSVANRLRLHLMLDPYYVFRLFKRMIGMKEKEKEQNGFQESKMHVYSLGQISSLFRKHGFHLERSMATSFGPPRVWQKELLPLSASIRLSERMRQWSDRKWGNTLKGFGNHFVVTLRKGPAPAQKENP